MHINELGLSPATLACLEAAGIADVEQLTSIPASDLLDRGLAAASLYETVCILAEHMLALRPVASGRVRVPDQRARELLRLRLIERLTLAEIGERHNISKERVRQLLALYFGLRGIRQ